MEDFRPYPESWLKRPRFDPESDPYEIQDRHQSLGDARTLEEKDRDKILYSPYLRRLGGVSQVVPSGMEQRIHNRLTHSLEVSQLARRIAEIEKTSSHARDLHLDPTVAETAGLAHDLGHAPFGHVGEEALDKLLSNYRNPLHDLPSTSYSIGGYEGNAQTFRILAVLGVSNREGQLGLNLR